MYYLAYLKMEASSTHCLQITRDEFYVAKGQRKLFQMITSCLQQLGSGLSISLLRNNSSLMCTANKAPSQCRRTSCTGTSNISFPSCKDSMVTCLLSPLGHGKQQHLDFKVNAKGRALYLKMKDKQQILGSPKLDCVLFPNCRSGLILIGTHTPCDKLLKKETTS